MKTIFKLSLALNVALVLAFGLASYVFVVGGNVEPSPDGRAAILVTTAERDHVLGEMRGFVEILQSITQALASNDMKTVAETARAAGMKKTQGESPAFMRKLPLEFKKLGFDTHRKLDALADLAATNPAPEVILGRVSQLMLNCVACHQSYLMKATD